MPYPNFKNKYMYKPLIVARQSNLEKSEIKLPDKCIITYQDECFNYLLSKFKDAKKLDEKFWGFPTYYTKDFLFFKMQGIGAPNAAWAFEGMIALGVKEFLNIGICAGLDNAGFFVCEKSIRDEGTSYHYVKASKYACPDKELTKKLENSFKKLNIKYEKSINWTLDAIFAYSKEEIKYYKKQGVKTADGELSALLVIAKLRKVKIAGAFFTSDLIGGDSWNNFYSSNYQFVKNGLEKLADISIDCFSKK